MIFRPPSGLRLPRHRATTAHVSCIYPFQAEQGLGSRGTYVGTNMLTGGGAFVFDPFEAYTSGLITSPNILVLGEVGSGKSASVKTLLYRSVGVFGSPGGLNRWVAVVDPKGEYGPLAQALGLDVIRLRPGGDTRLNPLDPGPLGVATNDEIEARRIAMMTALVSAVLKRDLAPHEDAALGWAVRSLTTRRRQKEPTLHDLTRLVASPNKDMAHNARMDQQQLARELDEVRYALGKLLDRELRGMFDGRSTINIDWSGRGLVLDLSAVHQDAEALTLVMIAATAWLQSLLAAPEGAGVPRRVQVLEECWALLGSEKVAKYLQSCWKLSRSYGVANIAVAHRISDLRAQSDDGTAANKVAMGLLSDTQTRVLFRQSTDQVEEARSTLGLTSAEASLLPALVRGRALWKVAGRSAVVQHVVSSDEQAFCDTDARLSLRESL